MIGNETGHLLECVMLHGKVINKNENYQMLKENIAATSLNILWKNLYALKCYAKCIYIKSMGNFPTRLNLFDQFIL